MASTLKLAPSLQNFLNLASKAGLDVQRDIVTPKDNILYISSGSTILNMLIGGSRLPSGNFVCPGWPRGRISEVFGREGSGKSTVALMGMAQAIQAGGTGIYFDFENAVMDNYARRLGCDFRTPNMGGDGKAVRISPNSAEEGESYIMAAALSGVDFIVIDSVAAMVPRNEASRNAADEKDKIQMAELARLMSRFLPKLQNVVAKRGSHVMFLNQIREKIGSFARSEDGKQTTVGGNALKFYSSLRMRLKPTLVAKAKRWNPLTKAWDEVPISTDVEAKNIKNKVDALQGHTMLFTIRYGVGIDELRSMLNVATAYGIIKTQKPKNKEKGRHVFSSPSTGVVVDGSTIESFRANISKPENTDVLKELLIACQETIVREYRVLDDNEINKLEEDSFTQKSSDEDDELEGLSEDPEEVNPEELGLPTTIEDSELS